jgi:hypothetical protein
MPEVTNPRITQHLVSLGTYSGSTVCRRLSFDGEGCRKRMLCRRLAVFAGAWHIERAERICGAEYLLSGHSPATRHTNPAGSTSCPASPARPIPNVPYS